VSFASAAAVDDIDILLTSRGFRPRPVTLFQVKTSDEISWSEQLPVINDKYRVMMLDLPGRGKSGSPNTVITTFLAKLKL